MIFSASSLLAFGLGGVVTFSVAWWRTARARAHLLGREFARAEEELEERTHALKAQGERRLNRAAERVTRNKERDMRRAEALSEDEVRLTELQRTLEERALRQEARQEAAEERSQSHKERGRAVKEQRGALKRLHKTSLSKLEERAETTREALSVELKAGYEAQAELESQRNAQQLIIHTEGYAQQRARELLSLNCQRYDDPRPAERLMGYVSLPRSAKKREALLHTDGALLSALGEVTGVEFILEGEREPRLALRNAPESFTKEVARLTFDRWLQGGLLTEQALRTHHRKAQTLLERQCHEAGAAAARRLNLKRVHPEVLYLVGKLLFRTSYTQNQWQHAIEAAELSGLIAEEIGLDSTLAKRATLLHDIGKVLWAETEAVGSHAVSGAAFAREHGELPEVIHPIAAHHHDEAPSSALAYLVIASDTLSGARPGARRETSEAFSQHVEQLEGLCAGLPNVRHHMVIQGGREVRLQLDERRYSDLEVARLSERLAVEIEDECVFPGQIKVTALRELVSYATAHTRRRHADPHTQHEMITRLGDRLSGGAWRGGEVRG